MKVFEFNNIKFYVGKSSKENWELLDKAKVEDQNFIWFHLDSFSSPYVIMWSSIDNLEKLKESTKSNESTVSIDQYLYYGANLCKEYSKYKYLKDIKIMYVPIKNLSKSDIIGEVIIKGKSKIIKL